NQDSISKIVDENSSTIATVSTSVSTENLQNFQISQIWIFYLFTHLLQILHPLLLTFLI
ncbi:22186_t:CDS:1, partial [Gigaspora rosea]